MSLLEIFLLSVGLAMDAFAVSVCKGMSLSKIKIKHMVITGLWFGGFQALMPLAGYLLGSVFAEKIDKYDHWIAFFMLTIIGMSMLAEARKDEEVDAAMDPKSMFILAVATSIDALAAGVSFAFLDVPIVLAITLVGVITFLISGAGVKLGGIFGGLLRSKASIAGGVILIMIAIKILVEGLMG